MLTEILLRIPFSLIGRFPVWYYSTVILKKQAKTSSMIIR
jgi:hypothetical protein